LGASEAPSRYGFGSPVDSAGVRPCERGPRPRRWGRRRSVMQLCSLWGVCSRWRSGQSSGLPRGAPVYQAVARNGNASPWWVTN